MALPGIDEIVGFVEGVTNSLNGVVSSATPAGLSSSFDTVINSNSFPSF